mmetsp:Transcript_32227/g.78595  ORF Transcript_32227/g.78595 Transcript_32227/m.78595 type:complete len:378 (+) Transcript_32227:160-1293(+)
MLQEIWKVTMTEAAAAAAAAEAEAEAEATTTSKASSKIPPMHNMTTKMTTTVDMSRRRSTRKLSVVASMVFFIVAATAILSQQQIQVSALNFNTATTKTTTRTATVTATARTRTSTQTKSAASTTSITTLSMSSKDSSSSSSNGGGGKDYYLSPETAFGAEVVPEGQRPVNEYLDMKRAPLFGWASNEVGLNGLLQRLGLFYVVVFATLGFPISGATFTQDGYLLQKIAAANVGTLGLVLVLLIRLYSGWGYVGARLQSKVIEYEESGWYDGNMELKTEAEFKRDQFLYKSDVKPAAGRVKNLTLGAAALWVASCVALNTAVAQKPLFNEYDPSVLERVRYDDTYASAAAKASASKPTYCDNRYYRAVAGGGQGCNF